MNVHYIITKQNINTVVGGRSYSISRENKYQSQIIEAIKNKDNENLLNLLDRAEGISANSDGKIIVRDGMVLYKGNQIHNVITERIIQFLDEGLPFEPLLRFLENLLENPSRRAVEEAYKFLEHKSLPLTEDGCFIAYKAVNSSFKDKYSNTFDNSIGKRVEIERNQVDDDARNGCSYGLHVGSIEYVKSFGSLASGDKFLIVKVNPRDIVSVPFDSDCQKMRVVGYDVIAEYEHNLEAPCYNAEANEPIAPKSKFANNSWKTQKRDSSGRFGNKVKK